MPVTALDTLRDRVEDFLKDATNADWSTGELDNAIRIALHELSLLLPARAATTVDAVTGQREYSISSISGLVWVVEVWYPYLSTHATYKKPHPVKWRMLDDSTLYLDAADDPDSAYKLRVMYDKLQTLEGLDSATGTTLNEQEKSLLVIEASGYAAMSLAVDKTDAVVLGGKTPENLGKWGWSRVEEFRRRLNEMAAQEDSDDDARIGWWSTDKWDA